MNDHEEDDFNDDGADDSAEVSCPYCGETQEVSLDPSGGASQQYVEDCQVCCRPWKVHVSWDADGRATVDVQPEGDEGDGGD